MEPKLSAPNRGPEHLPNVPGGNSEYVPSIASPEKRPEVGYERQEARQGASPANVTALPALPPVQVQSPAPVDDDGAGGSPSATPLVAADDDLIEKEWVDKAKAIVVKTKDDPYQREQEVGKLQADYLRKRYGKELSAATAARVVYGGGIYQYFCFRVSRPYRRAFCVFSIQEDFERGEELRAWPENGSDAYSPSSFE